MILEIRKSHCLDPEELGTFFIKNVNESYISFGDIYLCGRATEDLKWIPNLRDIIVTEIRDILSEKIQNKEVIAAFTDENLVGFAIVSKCDDIACLEDIVIDTQLRSKGLGKAFYKMIEDDLRKSGVKIIQLESSPSNHNAHSFFHSEGFKNSSVVMVKKLK